MRHENTPTLQKQVGCFNHRVVALVADTLERQWLLEVCFDVEDYLHKATPDLLPSFILQPQYMH